MIHAPKEKRKAREIIVDNVARRYYLWFIEHATTQGTETMTQETFVVIVSGYKRYSFKTRPLAREYARMVRDTGRTAYVRRVQP